MFFKSESYVQVGILVVLEPTPVEVQDHVHDAGVVTDDVEVAIVDQAPVVLESELLVRPAVIHEDVDHGEVDVSRVGNL